MTAASAPNEGKTEPLIVEPVTSFSQSKDSSVLSNQVLPSAIAAGTVREGLARGSINGTSEHVFVRLVPMLVPSIVKKTAG